MRDGFFSEANHGHDVGLHRVLHILHLNLGNVVALDLLTRVVDEDVDEFELFEMLLDELLTHRVLAQVAREEQALATRLFDKTLRLLSTVCPTSHQFFSLWTPTF